jgi:hypothetical protein
MAMTTCKECGKQVSTKAKTCPHCGAAAPAKKKANGGVGKWLLMVFAIGVFAAILSKQDKASPIASAPPKAPTVRAVEPPKAAAPSEEKLTEGQQKALNEIKAHSARLDKLAADSREQWDAKTKADAQLLRACLEHQGCESGTYARLLHEKPRAFVNDILGDPASVQNIGGREIHYFSVPTTDGRKQARLQLSYTNFTVESINVY